MSTPAAPEGYATVNPFIVTSDATEIVRFAVGVFGGQERAEARTVDQDGLLLQAEVRVGTTTLMFAERKPDWPFTPSLLQIYVDDIEAVIRSALARDAVLITEPTDFFGTRFARIQDAGANIWWVWQHGEPTWDETPGGEDWSGEDWSGEAASESWERDSPELAYIHDTLTQAMANLRNPRG